MTTTYRIRLDNGTSFLLRADLLQASSSIECCWDDASDDKTWQGTPYQVADARHNVEAAAQLVLEHFRDAEDEPEVEAAVWMPEQYTARITARGEDSQVPDDATAVDAEVLGDGIVIGDVTLRADGSMGYLDTWGPGLEHWADDSMREHLEAFAGRERATRMDWIVEAVRDAAEAAE